MTKRTHKQLKKVALSKPDVKKEYALLAEEFCRLKERLKIRLKSGKTQQT
jgi:hypothetical protein